jgi:ferritin-like metal-binding protein YciE
LTAITLAKRLGASEVASLLTESLNEELNAEKTLRKIASALVKTAPTELEGISRRS